MLTKTYFHLYFCPNTGASDDKIKSVYLYYTNFNSVIAINLSGKMYVCVKRNHFIHFKLEIKKEKTTTTFSRNFPQLSLI
jgi:hypothetical protein